MIKYNSDARVERGEICDLANGRSHNIRLYSCTAVLDAPRPLVLMKLYISVASWQFTCTPVRARPMPGGHTHVYAPAIVRSHLVRKCSDAESLYTSGVIAQ